MALVSSQCIHLQLQEVHLEHRCIQNKKKMSQENIECLQPSTTTFIQQTHTFLWTCMGRESMVHQQVNTA